LVRSSYAGIHDPNELRWKIQESTSDHLGLFSLLSGIKPEQTVELEAASISYLI